MNKQTASIGVVIALVIGGIVGYAIKPAADTSANDKRLAEAVTMMKDQSVAIKVMTEMMSKDATMMQELGVKYKDEDLTSMGKDMRMMSEKYSTESKAAESKGEMNEMMQ